MPWRPSPRDPPRRLPLVDQARAVLAAQVKRPGLWISIAGVSFVSIASRIPVGSIPPLLDHLGLNGIGESALVYVPTVCFALGALAGPTLQRRYGEERAIFFATILVLVGLLLRAVSPDWGLIPGTVVAGFGAAGLNVLLPSLIKIRFPDRVGDMTGLYATLVVIGTALSAGIAVPIYHMSNDSLEVALGVWSLPVAAAVLVWAPQLRVESHDSDAPLGGLFAYWHNPLALKLCFFISCHWLLFYAPFSWLAQIYGDKGIGDTDAGFLLMLSNLTAIPTTFAMPAWAARMKDQRLAVSIVVLATAFAFTGILLAPASTAWLWVSIFGLAQGAGLGLGLLLVVIRSADGVVAARMSAMAFSSAYVAAGLGILTMGALHQLTGSWSVPLIFLIVVCFASWLPGLAAARDRTIS
jgi:CP family cyanate transporter-like MFS transporter